MSSEEFKLSSERSSDLRPALERVPGKTTGELADDDIRNTDQLPWSAWRELQMRHLRLCEQLLRR